MLVISIVFCIAARRNAEVTPPKTLFGKSLNTDKTASGFFKRLLWYAADDLSFTVVLIAFSAYTERKFSSSFIFDSIIYFILFIFFDILFGEFRVYRYRKYTAKLDEEENNLND